MIRHLSRPALIAAVVAIVASPAFAHEPIPVKYTTEDGVQIVGDYWTPIRSRENAPAIILLHMYKSDRTAWSRDMIIALEYAGFAILRIDMRGHGESTKPEDMSLEQKVQSRDAELFNAMHKDVAGAMKWLAGRKEVDTSKVVLAGASVGCSVALDYAQRDKSIKAVALMSPGSNYLGIDSIAHIKKYGQRPLLMLTSQEERGRGFDQLSEEAKSSGVKLEAEVFDQSGIHGTGMFGKVEKVENKIADFLKKQVGS